MRVVSQMTALAVGLLAQVASANPIPDTQVEARAQHNDFSCRSSSHPNPVVLLHGLGATYYEDLNFLEAWLKSKGFCTFSITYGDYPGFPLVGGLQSIVEKSSQEIASFVKEVKQETQASKIDLVGHSEGAFQALYVTKFGGVSGFIGNVAAIAPPTHGTDFAGLITVAKKLGIKNGVDKVLEAFGCDACTDLTTGGAAIQKLNDGSITQAGVKYTIITSKHDELVTPTTTSFIEEPGVDNIYIQDYCPLDPAGHIGEAYDTNVWHLVLNALEEHAGRKFPCFLGPPLKMT